MLRVVLVIVAAVFLGGCDWPMIGFGPQNTFFNPSEPALTATTVTHLKTAWTQPCACQSTLLVAHGLVYAIDGYTGQAPYTPALRAFDASTGAPQWSRPLGSTTAGDELAAVANGLVYVTVRLGTGSDHLTAFDALTGAQRWSVTPPAPGTGNIAVSVALVDGTHAYVSATASDASEISAIDPSGHVTWSVVPGGFVLGGAALAADSGRALYVGSAFAAEPTPIVLVTKYPEDNPSAHTAAVVQGGDLLPIRGLAFDRGAVYGTFETAFGRLGTNAAFAIDPATGNVSWRADLFELAVTPDTVITNNPRTSTVNARDPATGAVRWSVSDNSFVVKIAGELVFGGSGVIRRLEDGTAVANVASVVGGASIAGVTPAAGKVYVQTITDLVALTP